MRYGLQLFFAELLEHAYAGRFVALGKYHVETDDRDLVFVEQFVEQQGQPVARPRPVAFAALFFLEQAFLVDIEYDDAVIDGTRHGQSQPRIVNNGLETAEQR